MTNRDCHWKGDWDDIEDYLFAEAERQIEWYEEYGKKELAE